MKESDKSSTSCLCLSETKGMLKNMKVLLYDTGDVRGELNEPIGIELLAAHVLNELKKQVIVDIKWFNFDGYSFDPLQYDIIGISIHINGLSVFDNIYKLCCECHFKGMLVAGNSIATFAYEQLLEQYPDIICSIGEGEYTFKEIVKRHMSGCFNPAGIPNLAYLDHGSLVVTERSFFAIRDYLPPLRIFNEQIKVNRGIARIEASRGCIWNRCNFCGAAHKYNNAGWRTISIDIIIEQLVELSEAGLKTIYFCDEDFIGNDTKRFAILVDKIREKMDAGEIDQDMKFFISVKPTDLINTTNIEIIKRFMNCGLKDLFVGLESGCDKQLKRYNKCTNVKINSMVVSRINELINEGLTIDIGFIFFDYNMTPDDIEENIRFIESNRLYTLASSLIKPLRIQPYTKTYTDTTEVHGNEFSTDDLMYYYHFADDTVEQIHSAYSELKLEALAHKIQSVYRREMSSEIERELSEKNLIVLRFLQFSAIKTIAAHYICNEIDEPQLKSRLNEILRQAMDLLP